MLRHAQLQNAEIRDTFKMTPRASLSPERPVSTTLPARFIECHTAIMKPYRRDWDLVQCDIVQGQKGALLQARNHVRCTSLSSTRGTIPDKTPAMPISNSLASYIQSGLVHNGSSNQHSPAASHHAKQHILEAMASKDGKEEGPWNEETAQKFQRYVLVCSLHVASVCFADASYTIVSDLESIWIPVRRLRARV